MAEVGTGKPRDGVHHQQRRVGRRIDRAAHRSDVGGDARGRFVVHDADRFQSVLLVGTKTLLDQIGLHAAAPAVGHAGGRIDARHAQELRLQPEPQRHLLPQGGKVAGLEHQHRITRTHRVGERRLPRASARGRVDHHRVLGLEHLAQPRDHFEPEGPELRAPMIDRRQAHRAQDAIGHRARPGDLQEVAAAGVLVERNHRSGPFDTRAGTMPAMIARRTGP